MKTRIKTTILLLFLTAPILLGSAYRDAADGVKAYEEGDYSGAADEFRGALMTEPESPLLRHDIALSLYKLEEYEKALEELNRALESAETEKMRADVHYDMGNVYFQTDSLTRAILHYQKALELNPEDADAKYNLELARAILKEFSEKKQQQNQQQKQQKQQQQDDQQKQDQQKQDQQEQKQQEQEQQEQQQDEEEKDREQQQQQPKSGEELTKEEAERMLKALEDQEEELQKEKMRRRGGGAGRTDKPW